MPMWQRMSSMAPLITFLRVMRYSLIICATEMEGAGMIRGGWNTSAFVACISLQDLLKEILASLAV